MLDYRIKTFLTLYNEMNYRKTAELLHMTQPGVTHHIHFIEEYYGVKLFSYNGKTLSKTKYAETLKRHIDSILSEEKEIFREFSQKEKLVLNVGATKTIGEFVLVPVVREFLRDANHSVNLFVDNTENLLRMLENAELDFAVVEGVFDKEKYHSHIYKKEKFVGICAKTHPFAGKCVKLEEVFTQTLIAREQGSGTRRLLEQAVWDRGYRLDRFSRVISAGNFSVITDMVAHDQAVTFAYEPVVHSRRDLAVFRVEDMEIRGEFNFVYCNRKTGLQKIRLLFGGDDPLDGTSSNFPDYAAADDQLLMSGFDNI